MAVLLIVEDDTATNEAICEYMRSAGHITLSALDGEQGLQIAREKSVDLVVLDIMLPKRTGLEVLKELRQTSNIPILMLTALDDEPTQAASFDEQADDYITKPFPNSVLRHKVKAIFSMLESPEKEPPHKVYDDGLLMIDFSSLRTVLAGEEIILAPLEYRMLEILTSNKGILLTRQKLLENLWDSQENYVDEHTLTAAISRIRGKIERGGHKYIRTVYGMGYMFTDGGTR